MIRKIGKVGRANQFARKKIAQYCEANNMTNCELGLVDSCYVEAHAPAHRHPRVWYRSCPEKLYDPIQWVPACTNCHNYLDNVLSADESEEIFLRLRGPE
jgi:hypothetical protein